MPTHQIRSSAAESHASGERNGLDNAVYFKVYEGESMAFTDYTSHGAVAVITLKNPPVNALGVGLRTAIADGVARATADETIREVVIGGSGIAFCGGGDVRQVVIAAIAASPSLAALSA